VRNQIYRLLFSEAEDIKFTTSRYRSKLRVSHNSDTGLGLCFACRTTQEESRPILYSILRWNIVGYSPSGNSLAYAIARPFYHTNLIRTLELHIEEYSDFEEYQSNFLSKHLVSSDKFMALQQIYLHGNIRLSTWDSPDGLTWSEMEGHLKYLRRLPGRIVDTIRSSSGSFKVYLMVECEYYPYMRSARKCWYDSSSIRTWLLAASHHTNSSSLQSCDIFDCEVSTFSP
jgi:hypothetical protein